MESKYYTPISELVPGNEISILGTFEKNIPNIDSIWSSRQFNSDETDDFMSVYGGKED